MNEQSLTYLLTAVSQVGFPIVLTGYLLIRFEKKLEALSQNILKLTEEISKHTSVDHHDK